MEWWPAGQEHSLTVVSTTGVRITMCGMVNCPLAELDRLFVRHVVAKPVQQETGLTVREVGETDSSKIRMS